MDQDLGVRLGTHRTPALREIAVGLDEKEHGQLGEVQVSAAALAGVPADYRAEARLLVSEKHLTAGWVTTAKVELPEVAIEVRNRVILSEQVIGYLSFANMTGDEMAWSMAQWMGMTPACARSPKPLPWPCLSPASTLPARSTSTR
jgi:hypothetical protein